jgi:hypothetical protein
MKTNARNCTNRECILCHKFGELGKDIERCALGEVTVIYPLKTSNAGSKGPYFKCKDEKACKKRREEKKSK